MDFGIKKEQSEENLNQNSKRSSNPFENQREQQLFQLQQNQLLGMGYNGMSMPALAMNNSMGMSPYMNSPIMGNPNMGIPMNMQQHMNPNMSMMFPPSSAQQHGIPAYLLGNGTGSPTLSNDMMDPIRSHRNSFDALSDYNFRIQQMAVAQQQQQQQQAALNMHQQQSGGFRNEKMEPSNNQKNSSSSIGNSSAEERYQQLMEKEAKWSEVRKYSDLIRRFATDAVNVEITKENYYDLYNMAVCLLRSVDSLDPDKTHSMIHLSQRKPSNEAVVSVPQQMNNNFLTPATPASTSGLQQADLEFLQARKSFDVYFSGRGSVDGSYMPKFSVDYSHLFSLGNGNGLSSPSNPNSSNGNSTTPVKSEFPSNTSNNTPKPSNSPSNESNNSHDNDDQSDERRTSKRRRRRTVYSSRRNLHCHMCGVTETPEWRRGPAGDHTLCNACGLHWAKSQKKKPNAPELVSTGTTAKLPPPEGRKHSIDMILNNRSASPNEEGSAED